MKERYNVSAPNVSALGDIMCVHLACVVFNECFDEDKTLIFCVILLYIFSVHIVGS